jgi:hypothetical protein
MSAPQDKRKRNVKSSGFGAGNDKRGKEASKAKVTAKAALITVVAVAVLFAAALLLNSEYLRQNFTAVKVDGVKYSVTDFNYYYQNAYAQYYNAMNNSGGFGQAMLPNQNESLKSQVYDEETGETWSEFFKRMALDQIKADNKIYKAATDAGFTLSDEDTTKLNDDIDTLKQNGLASGYTDFGQFLKAVYGKGMTEAEYRQNAERSYVITSYTTHVRDSFQYSSTDLESYYTTNKDNFDTFTYRYFLVSAGSIKDIDYVDEQATSIAKAAAVAATVLKAEEYASTITSEQAFIDAAREYDPETNKEDSATQRIYQGNLLGSVYGPWLRDSARQYGDVTTTKSSNGTYVVYFIGRDDNHYATVNIRQLVVMPETIDPALYASETTDDAYNTAVEKAKQTALDSANKIYDEWTKGGATEDQLTQMTMTYAAEISLDDSQQLLNVYRQQLPEAVSDWLFDPARKAGDYTQIYNETTGYHIIYFEAQDKLYSDYLADKDKRDKDLQAWKDSLTGSDPTTTWLMTIAG